MVLARSEESHSFWCSCSLLMICFVRITRDNDCMPCVLFLEFLLPLRTPNPAQERRFDLVEQAWTWTLVLLHVRPSYTNKIIGESYSPSFSFDVLHAFPPKRSPRFSADFEFSYFQKRVPIHHFCGVFVSLPYTCYLQ